jgi:lipoate---protein ligase
MAQLRIFHDGALTGEENMARDAEFLASHKPGDAPILRLYRWLPAAITIGYNQSFDDFEKAAVSAEGYDLVRRPTGGRAILHADEITYAIIASSPGDLFGDTLHATYMKINEALLLFLKNIGINAEISGGESRAEAGSLVCFKSAGHHEIRVAGRKIIGSAQRRTGGVFLQHGSILAGPRHLDLPHFLKAGARGNDIKPEELALVTTDLQQELGRRLSGNDLDEMMKPLAEAFMGVLS